MSLGYSDRRAASGAGGDESSGSPTGCTTDHSGDSPGGGRQKISWLSNLLMLCWLRRARLGDCCILCGTQKDCRHGRSAASAWGGL